MRHLRWIGLVGGLLLAATGAQAAEPTEPSAAPAETVEVQPLPAHMKLSEYWIGILCRPVLPKELRAHVKLPEKQGLLVDEVVPEGPAAKSGIQPMDILVKVDGRPIAKIADLVEAVEAAKDKELAIEVFREGKSLALKIVPEKRPADFQAKKYPALPEYPELDRIYQWFDRAHPGWGGKPPMRLRFYRPGMILPADALMHPALPKSMAIIITKRESEPTRIKVEKDAQTWEVTEKELDTLPKEVRPYVDRMLEGRVFTEESGGPRFDFMPDWVTPGKPAEPAGGQKQPARPSGTAARQDEPADGTASENARRTT